MKKIVNVQHVQSCDHTCQLTVLSKHESEQNQTRIQAQQIRQSQQVPSYTNTCIVTDATLNKYAMLESKQINGIIGSEKGMTGV